MQDHAGLLQRAAAFFVIAGGAGGDDIFPGVRAVQMARLDVIDGQRARGAAAILAGVIIAPEYLFTGHLYFGAGAVDHVFQADHGGTGKRAVYGANYSPAIHHQLGFVHDHQTDRFMHVTNIQWFVICV